MPGIEGVFGVSAPAGGRPLCARLGAHELAALGPW